MTSRLEELAAKVERLTGPCRETDAEIKLAFAAQLFAGGTTKDEAVRILGGDLYAEAMPYTASLDAAMTLVPELKEIDRPLHIKLTVSESGNWYFASLSNWKLGEIRSSKCKAWPIALSSVLLCARASMESTHDR